LIYETKVLGQPKRITEKLLKGKWELFKGKRSREEGSTNKE
jgi:hypothetical protein